MKTWQKVLMGLGALLVVAFLTLLVFASAVA
jgi:hypothetical protein